MSTEYKPEVVLNVTPSLKYGLVVLNRPLEYPSKFLSTLWNKAAVRVTVDGGTDRWFSYVKRNGLGNDVVKVDLVTGDFDSITEDSLNIVKEKGAKVVSTPDQDETDFTKSMRELAKYCSSESIKLDTVIVLHETSGRIDHILANFNTLYTKSIQELFLKTQILLLSSDSLSWLLRTGKSTIAIPDVLQNKKKVWCGLIPIGEKCEWLTTTGLKWNLNGDSMEFGKLVSTSNTYDGSKIVTVDTRTPLLWCMDVSPILSQF